jgi:hypothetical protein
MYGIIKQLLPTDWTVKLPLAFASTVIFGDSQPYFTF